MKAYIVINIGWEYNDEFFYTTDGEPGNIDTAYKSKEKAEEYCYKKNIEEARSTLEKGYFFEFGSYHENVEKEELIEIVNNHDNEELKEFVDKNKDHYDFFYVLNGYEKWAEVDDKIIQDIMGLNAIKFYKVQEVEVEDG